MMSLPSNRFSVIILLLLLLFTMVNFMHHRLLLILPFVLFSNLQGRCRALSMRPPADTPKSNVLSRRDAMVSAAISAITTTAAWNNAPSVAQAATGPTRTKREKLSNDELADVLRNDVEVNQFMVSADITRDVYDESATFTDEIDTYQMDQWIKGTKRLFVAEKSHVDMVSNTIQVSDAEASFLFTETLLFNIPIIKPKVYLSGKVVFTRDPKTGLITSYREQWDQDVNTVLTKANLFSN